MAKRKAKKRATKRAQRRTPLATPKVEVLPARTPSEVGQAIETLQQAAEHYREAAASVPDGGEMPFELIQVAEFATRAGTPIKDISAAFKTTVLRLERTDGTFEDRDEFIVAVKTTKGRVATAWKDEATRLAQELAALRGEEFNERQYHAEVAARSPRKPDTQSVELLTR